MGSIELTRPAYDSTAFQDELKYVVSDRFTKSRDSVPSQYTRVSFADSQWIAELSARFDELLRLKDGWDGYHGKALSFNTAMFVANLLEVLYLKNVPAPELVPGSDGSVQIEWHCWGFDIEIDVLSPYQIDASRFCHSTNQLEETELTVDFSILSQWLAVLRDAGVIEDVA